jgi:hypothetical protein
VAVVGSSLGGKPKDGRHKLFNRAYDKAVLRMPLTETEEKELLRYLYARPFKTVPCQKCEHLTRDKDRSGKPYFLPRGIRMCGPCCEGRDGREFWTSPLLTS